MPILDMNKNIIKWGLVFLLGVGLIIAIVFLLKKSSQTNSVTINLSIQGPYPKPRTARMNLNKSDLPSLTVFQLVGSVINTTKILPWSINDTYWLSMSISGKTVQISDGQITAKAGQQSLYSLLGIKSPPNSIDFSATYKNSCSQNNYPKNLNPCLGQTGICTSTGWSIVNYTYCPSGDDIYSCCTDPLNPYASCVDNKVVCGPCSPDNIPNCGDPGCGLIGLKCTAKGWTCAPGYACPTGSSLAACCTGIDHATCTMVGGRASLICSGCTGDPPTCTPDCNMCGPVCNSDGTWSCKQGAYCPSKTIVDSCCKDPNKPRAFCSPLITNGAPCDSPSQGVGVKCDNCEKSVKPPDPRCEQGSCEGHGYVCTSTGWICAPGVVCPDPNKFGSWQKCCPTGYMANSPYCDTSSNCIKCGCPPGFTGCGGSLSCGSPNSQCNQICCENGIPCNLTSDGQCICCEKSQICNYGTGNTTCCGAGEVCVPGQGCVSACGIDSVGKIVTCNPGETCIVVDNLNPDVIANLRYKHGDKVRFNSLTNPTQAFLCLQDASPCNFSWKDSVSVPASNGNYHPCYDFPIDIYTKRAGYCTEKDNTSTQACLVFNDKFSCNSNPTCNWQNNVCTSKTSNISQCFHNNYFDCKDAPNCTWRDVLTYMTTDSNPIKTWQQIQAEMAIMQNDPEGHYCQPSSGGAFQRVFAIPGSTACSVDDCWSRFAQPGMTDVEFGITADGTQTMCVLMQQCVSDKSGNMQTYQYSKGSLSPNTYTQPTPPAITSSSFSQCSTNPTCPPVIPGYGCDNNTGRIIPITYTCVSDPSLPSPAQICKQVYDGSGEFTDPTCGSSCGCAPGFTRSKTQNKCYHNVYLSGGGPGACNHKFGSCDFSSCNGDPDGCGVPGWEQTCHGSCMTRSCRCDCFIPEGGIPNNYMYCEYDSKTWKQCQNPAGCSDSGRWGNLKDSNECLQDNDETGSYCIIPP